MSESYRPIADLLARVRSRWRQVVVSKAVGRIALAEAAVLALGYLATRVIPTNVAIEAALAVAVLVTAIGVLVWGLRGVADRPADARIARFIEERYPELDERLVSAVGVETAADPATRSPLADAMLRDAARAIAVVEPDGVVAARLLRRMALLAAAAVVVLGVLGYVVRDQVRQSYDAIALALFPSRIELQVEPGDARIEAGSGLTVRAHLVGNRAPVIAQLLRAEGEGEEEWRPAEMETTADGRFSLSMSGLSRSFRYRVTAGPASSKIFTVSVVRAPRVTRIDVEYKFPEAFAIPDRVEADGGDIYAPAGTDVRVHVHTDRPAASGKLMLAGDQPIELVAENSDRLFSGSLQVASDSSYRVTLADREGLASRGDTEYFIRTLEDRPPEVHVVRPASDRRVTRLEEVDIEAEAQDDFGIRSLELVYALRGGPETVVPLKMTPQGTSAVGRDTLFLEDLDVRPGDFVSYYVRARDIPRGKRSSEARSDIFFLEVKPFEEEFTLAQSQAAMGGGQGNQQLDDLVNAQKEIIVATWKLDRRSRSANGAKSSEDIRAVGQAERELKVRVEQASSAFRQSNMRDPRARPNPGRGGAPPPPPPGPRAGQTLAEEDDMTAASNAMGRAVTALDKLSTADAVAPEMDALNHLLKAQADVKKRQIQQQAGSGAGNNRASQDLSSLFDKELARHQQTNYENRDSAAQKEEEKASAIDRIKDLASRQDELLRRQQNLARNQEQMTSEERKRALEELTREQNELRQRAEEIAQQLARQQGQQQGQERQERQAGQAGQAGQAQQSGQQQGQGQQPSGQPGQQAGQSGRPGESGQRRPGEQGAPTGSQPQGNGQGSAQGNAMNAVSEEMRRATSDLRRDDAGQASERASRALDRLRELQRQIQNASPDGQRRALGDAQLEARQLADAERQIASQAGRGGSNAPSSDQLRRMAGEQERLAERVRQIEEALNRQAGQSSSGGKAGAEQRGLAQAAGEASKDLQRQRLAERMEQAAEAMRASADGAGGRGGRSNDGKQPAQSNATQGSQAGTQGSQEEIARALDRLADRLAVASRSGDDESRRMADQLARAQDLRERMDDLTRQMEQLAQATPDPRGQGQSAAGGGQDSERLRAEIERELEQVRQLLDDTRGQGTTGRGGPGRTFETQGMVLSAPGTEAFKQDFAKWQELKRQATAALESVESSLAARLKEKDTKDRLAAGADDTAPAAYQRQVDSYFRALAAKKKP